MKSLVAVPLLLGVLSFCGCAARLPEQPITPDSPLSKISVGMKTTQVEQILGKPSAEKEYITGKAFIPFYFGDEDSGVCWYYKGIGRVRFAGGSAYGYGGGEVVKVESDLSETGVAR